MADAAAPVAKRARATDCTLLYVHIRQDGVTATIGTLSDRSVVVVTTIESTMTESAFVREFMHAMVRLAQSHQAEMVNVYVTNDTDLSIDPCAFIRAHTAYANILAFINTDEEAKSTFIGPSPPEVEAALVGAHFDAIAASFVFVSPPSDALRRLVYIASMIRNAPVVCVPYAVT